MTVESYRTTRRCFLQRLGMALPALSLGPGLVSVRATPVVPPAPDLSFLARQMTLKRRHEWTDIAPNPDRLRVAENLRYNRITVHHSGTEIIRVTSEQAVIRCLDGVLGGHLRRRFGDVGYHFMVDYAGRVWEGRSLSFWGAHVSGNNDHNVGIVLLGNFEHQRPSRAQLNSMRQLVGLIQQQYRIRQQDVYGHIDLGQTLCPGKYLYPAVRHLKQRV